MATRSYTPAPVMVAITNAVTDLLVGDASDVKWGGIGYFGCDGGLRQGRAWAI